MYAVVLALAMTFAAAAAGQEDSYASVWKSVEGKRGTLKQEHGENVFTLDDAGGMVIVHVGRDYAEFARFTREKGERRTHRFIPLSRLVLRQSRLTR